MVNIFSPSGLMKYTIVMEGDGRSSLLDQIKRGKKLRSAQEPRLTKENKGAIKAIKDSLQKRYNDLIQKDYDEKDASSLNSDAVKGLDEIKSLLGIENAKNQKTGNVLIDATANRRNAMTGENDDGTQDVWDTGDIYDDKNVENALKPTLSILQEIEQIQQKAEEKAQEEAKAEEAEVGNPADVALTPPNAGQGKGAATAAKPKRYLILTSSGGGGHISAAKAKEDEIKKNHPGAIVEIIDLMGLYEKAANKDKPWIPTIYIPGKGELFSGKANTAKWNEAQKAGGMDAVRNLEGLVELQHIAESIQHRKVYKSLKKYLAENDVEEIFDTQALSTPAVCQAIHEHNEDEKKKDPQYKELKVTKIVTEFLSHRAVHFLDPLSKIAAKYKNLITVQVVEPPLLGPGESLDDFKKRHNVEDINFEFLSDSNIEPPVREEFKNDHSGKFTYSETNGKKETITKKDGDHLSFITLGSQGSETILKYVNSYIDQIGKNNTTGTKYLCITAGEPGQGSLHEKISQLIEARKDEIPDNVQILPLGMQNGEEMASMMQNCDVLVTRTGGMSSMEAKVTQKFAKNRQVYLHSEQTVEHPAGFPNTNRDAIYEGLISGAVKWEAGNAEYLMKDIKAQMANYQTIAFNASGTVQQQSLFELAYEDELAIKNKELIESLIYSGSNPNLVLPGGSHLIDHCADFETTKLLVEHGAKITEKVKEKFTSAEILILEIDQNTFNTKYKQGVSRFHTRLKEAIEEEKIEDIKGISYLHDEIKYHKIKGENKSLLSHAVENNKNKAVEALVSTGYNKGNQHQLDEALHIAVEVNNVDAARHLLQNGANPHRWGLLKKNLVPKFEKEPGIYHDMLKMFIREGVINPAKYELTLPKNISADSLMDITFEEGNKFGNTAVHIAIHQHNNNLIDDDKLKEILIQNIGDINKKNIDGLRPIDLTNHQKTRKILAAFGANPKSIKGVPTTKNELGELQRNYSAFQSLFEKNEKVIKQAFATADNADDFADKLFESISLNYDKNSNEYVSIKKTFTNTFEELDKARDELKQQNIIKRLVNSILKIFGADKLNKAVKEEAKNLPENIRDDYLKL